ncbi:3-hydroxybenzoate 6-hydroxylase isoform X2 [Ricinus communis]|uniref:3-hydroxybenzoate 6-hydroxylase isoform X2 n=1 Tax=Ricinus communis TaxID=3988 RepID=UPI00201A87A8|nr:3-hydroxybenzoate 6-hydroxylase isoform X2 [Ricinus communis]
MSKKQKPKAIIVGGSIAGISCAHALISAGWNVLVLEKSNSPPKGSSTGAGLRIDLLSQKIIKSWFSQPQRFQEITFPLAMDQNVVTDGDNTIRILTRDENFNFRTAHWADLHGLLYNDLPPEIFLWGYLCFSFCNSEGKTSVNVKAKCLQTDEIIELNGDLLVAADGGQSTIRRILLPDLKLRYSGYCAWRGVLDFSGKRSSDTVTGLKKVYPDLGNCSYFHLSSGSHSVLYELRKEELNWVWYVHHPEPELKIVWENVVLIGDAAHPTTPHGARSTNMAIADAAVLGKCLGKWRVENLPSALEEYQHLRLPVTSKQVLHSRRMGRIKQGLSLPDRKPFDPKTATPEDCEELQDKNMPFFAGVPGLDGR